MKFKNLVPILVLMMAFAIIAPANGYVDPFRNNEIPTELGNEDHPWGGDNYSGTENPTVNPPTHAFIWMPLSFIDFIRMIPYLSTCNDLLLIKGDPNAASGDQPSLMRSRKYSTFNPGEGH
jgi:hypothetical protein